MTGFLGRMAARAGGAAPGVSPRVLSRFELSGGGEPTEPTPAPETAGTTRSPDPVATTLPRTAAAAPLRTAAPTPARPRVREAAPPSPRREERAVTRPEVATPARMPDRAAPSGLPPLAPPREPVPVAEATTPPKEPPRARPAAPVVVAALPAPKRTDVLASRPPAADRSRSGERVASSSPDVIHLSIGRVDVRATVVQQAPAARPAPAAKQPTGEALSLGDYLRGKREAS